MHLAVDNGSEKQLVSDRQVIRGEDRATGPGDVEQPFDLGQASTWGRYPYFMNVPTVSLPTMYTGVTRISYLPSAALRRVRPAHGRGLTLMRGREQRNARSSTTR
jgi:hypothetical protein